MEGHVSLRYAFYLTYIIDKMSDDETSDGGNTST